MAVKETPETNATDVELEWNAENELQLFQVLCGNKPIGCYSLLNLNSNQLVHPSNYKSIIVIHNYKPSLGICTG